MPIVTQPLYAPTATEIAHVAGSAKRRHPDMAGRIDKAAAIIAAGLQLEPVAWEVRNVVHWHISSQSHKGAYIVNALHCPCQDSRAAIVAGVRSCKHAAAVALYQKIMRNHLNGSIRNRALDLGITHTGSFNCYATRLGICHIYKNGSSYDFVDQASMVRYSIWLAQQPVAVEQWPVRELVAA